MMGGMIRYPSISKNAMLKNCFGQNFGFGFGVPNEIEINDELVEIVDNIRHRKCPITYYILLMKRFPLNPFFGLKIFIPVKFTVWITSNVKNQKSAACRVKKKSIAPQKCNKKECAHWTSDSSISWSENFQSWIHFSFVFSILRNFVLMTRNFFEF